MLAVSLSWYTTTADFQRRVGTQVRGVLEDSTGGKVDLGRISLDLWHLAIEVDGLVIHGTEGPGEAPYLSAARIFVRLKINTVISHTVGRGAQSRIGLNYLEVDQPHAHLIIDKDGKTNQPVPKHPSTSTEPVQDSLLDLQAKQVLLNSGFILINDRAIPFDADATNLNARVQYLPSTDRYGIDVDLADLQTQMVKQPVEHSKLHLDMRARPQHGRARRTRLLQRKQHAPRAPRTHRALRQPSLAGRCRRIRINLRQVGYLAGVEGFTSGDVALTSTAATASSRPQRAQRTRLLAAPQQRPSPVTEQMLAPDPDCTGGYLLVGDIKATDAGFVTPTCTSITSTPVPSSASTPTQLLFSALTGRLPGGGTIDGELKIENWLGEVPASAPSTSPTTVAAANTANNTAANVGAKAPVDPSMYLSARAHAFAKVTLNGITLRTILDITAPNKIGDLGLDTELSGPVTAEWGGPATDIASSVQVGADLTSNPSARHGRPPPTSPSADA